MEAPKAIFADWSNGDRTGAMSRRFRRSGDDTKFIRADLANKLKGYKILHKPDCKVVSFHFDDGPWKESGCTCGLANILKEME